MSVSVIEPRSFVKQIPLPIPSHRGIAIQARSSDVYNATVPTRAEIRHDNYQRRLQQLSHQGFHSAIDSPYQSIGNPVDTNDEELIRRFLGQMVEKNQDQQSIEEDSKTWYATHKKATQQQQRRQIPTLKVSTKRALASELQIEVQHGGNLIQQMRKGHSLFNLLENEHQQKVDSKRLEMLRLKEKKRTEMRPPRFSSDESDEDSDENEMSEASDVEIYGANEENCDDGGGPNQVTREKVVQRPFSTGVIDGRKVLFQTDGLETSDAKSRVTSSKTSARIGSSKHHLPQRPYTPQHSNIAAAELNAAPDKELIETDAERNRRMNTERTEYERRENNWKQLTSGTASKERRRSPTRVRGLHHRSRPLPQDMGSSDAVDRRASIARRESVSWHDLRSRRDSVMSSSAQSEVSSSARFDGRPPDAMSTYSDSQSSVGLLVDESSSKDEVDSARGGVDTSRADKIVAGPDAELEMDDAQSATMVAISREATSQNSAAAGDFLTSSGSAVTTLLMAANAAEKWRRSSAHGTVISAGGRSKTPTTEGHKSPAPDLAFDYNFKKLSHREKILNKINKLDQETNWQRPRDELAGFRATSLVRPKRTAVVDEFEASAPSTRYGNMPQSMHHQFRDVVKESEDALNDKLEALSRERMEKLRSKYYHEPTEPCVDVALRAMREKYLQSVKERKKDIVKKKKIEIYHKWYTDLLQGIPVDIKNSWDCRKIMDKLGKYGLVEAGKQSAIKFQKALTRLRVWEVCSPDVSAAVEYCRERVVEMSVEDYERWFAENFPKVVRPQVTDLTENAGTEAPPLKQWQPRPLTATAGQSRTAVKSAPAKLHMRSPLSVSVTSG